jgi:ribosomal protein S18 acetylase RimI-like enzyme
MTVMTQTAVPVSALERSQFAVAHQTLVDAFGQDPMVVYFFPRTSKRVAGCVQIFRVTLRHGLCGGVVDVVQGGQGVAIWLQSEYASLSLWSMWRLGFPAAGLALGFRASRRILQFMHELELRRKDSLAGPHWYLLNLAVRPELQGQGLGSTLLRYGLNRAQQQGRPCFLETSKAGNVPFYQRHGFRVVSEGRPSTGGPPVWSFVKSV